MPLSIPPSKEPIFLRDGKVNPIWLLWFNELRKSLNNAATNIDNPNEDNFVAMDVNGDMQDSGFDHTSFVKVDGTQDIVQTGEWSVGGAVNKSTFEADGTLKFEGDATVWNDKMVSLSGAKIPAANAPNWAKITDDGAGSTGVFGWHFDDSEYIEFHIQMPHDWKEGSRIYPHVHFECTSDVDPTDKFDLELEYFWVDINVDRPANTTLVNRECETGVNTDTMHQIVGIPAAGIDGTGHTISSVLMCRLERVAAGADNYADQIIFKSVDIHYEVDTAGSRQALSK